MEQNTMIDQNNREKNEQTKAKERNKPFKEKLDKYDCLSQIVGNIAHDLNNFLVAITGNLSLAKAYTNPESKAYPRLNEAEKGCVRIKETAYKMSIFARTENPKLKEVFISRFIKNSISVALQGATINVVFDLPDNLPTVVIDESLMREVFRSIIANSLTAIMENGEILVSCELCVVDETSQIPLNPGSYVKVTIKDNGSGFPPEKLENIFEPTFKTKVGFGLPTSYYIVKKHNGHIIISSEPDKGTECIIYIPSHDKDRIMKVKRILVMDDEEAIRDVLMSMLNHLGYDVELTSDGEEAIRSYEASMHTEDEFTAVILDLIIPGGMGGSETIKKLKCLNPNVKIILTSGYTGDPAMNEAKEEGFSAYLAKPFGVEDVENILNSTLSKEK
jgi:CheY-like chemotaxis protein